MKMTKLVSLDGKVNVSAHPSKVEEMKKSGWKEKKEIKEIKPQHKEGIK